MVLRILLYLSVLLLVGACGQKGDLYLPSSIGKGAGHTITRQAVQEHNNNA